MRKADDHDLREALSEEVERLEPSEQLWNNIYQRSVVKHEKRRKPWLTSALAMGAAAAAAAVFLLNGQVPGSTPEPPVGIAPAVLSVPGEEGPGVKGARATPFTIPVERPAVNYQNRTYLQTGESVPPEAVGELLTLTTDVAGDPQPDGFTTTLAAGLEIRSVKGLDPGSRIAVQADQGWSLFEASPNQ